MEWTDKIRRRLEDGERIGFRLAAQAVFFVLLGLLILVSVAANSVLLGVLAAFAVGLMLRAVLPAERFKMWVRGYASGEAGDRWRRRFDAITTRLGGILP